MSREVMSTCTVSSSETSSHFTLSVDRADGGSLTETPREEEAAGDAGAAVLLACSKSDKPVGMHESIFTSIRHAADKCEARRAALLSRVNAMARYKQLVRSNRTADPSSTTSAVEQESELSAAATPIGDEEILLRRRSDVRDSTAGVVVVEINAATPTSLEDTILSRPTVPHDNIRNSGNNNNEDDTSIDAKSAVVHVATDAHNAVNDAAQHSATNKNADDQDQSCSDLAQITDTLFMSMAAPHSHGEMNEEGDGEATRLSYNPMRNSTHPNFTPQVSHHRSSTESHSRLYNFAEKGCASVSTCAVADSGANSVTANFINAKSSKHSRCGQGVRAKSSSASKTISPGTVPLNSPEDAVALCGSGASKTAFWVRPATALYDMTASIAAKRKDALERAASISTCGADSIASSRSTNDRRSARPRFVTQFSRNHSRRETIKEAEAMGGSYLVRSGSEGYRASGGSNAATGGSLGSTAATAFRTDTQDGTCMNRAYSALQHPHARAECDCGLDNPIPVDTTRNSLSCGEGRVPAGYLNSPRGLQDARSATGKDTKTVAVAGATTGNTQAEANRLSVDTTTASATSTAATPFTRMINKKKTVSRPSHGPASYETIHHRRAEALGQAGNLARNGTQSTSSISSMVPINRFTGQLSIRTRESSDSGSARSGVASTARSGVTALVEPATQLRKTRVRVRAGAGTDAGGAEPATMTPRESDSVHRHCARLSAVREGAAAAARVATQEPVSARMASTAPRRTVASLALRVTRASIDPHHATITANKNKINNNNNTNSMESSSEFDSYRNAKDAPASQVTGDADDARAMPRKFVGAARATLARPSKPMENNDMEVSHRSTAMATSMTVVLSDAPAPDIRAEMDNDEPLPRCPPQCISVAMNSMNECDLSSAVAAGIKNNNQTDSSEHENDDDNHKSISAQEVEYATPGYSSPGRSTVNDRTRETLSRSSKSRRREHDVNASLVHPEMGADCRDTISPMSTELSPLSAMSNNCEDEENGAAHGCVARCEEDEEQQERPRTSTTLHKADEAIAMPIGKSTSTGAAQRTRRHDAAQFARPVTTANIRPSFVTSSPTTTTAATAGHTELASPSCAADDHTETVIAMLRTVVHQTCRVMPCFLCAEMQSVPMYRLHVKMCVDRTRVLLSERMGERAAGTMLGVIAAMDQRELPTMASSEDARREYCKAAYSCAKAILQSCGKCAIQMRIHDVKQHELLCGLKYYTGSKAAQRACAAVERIEAGYMEEQS